MTSLRNKIVEIIQQCRDCKIDDDGDINNCPACLERAATLLDTVLNEVDKEVIGEAQPHWNMGNTSLDVVISEEHEAEINYRIDIRNELREEQRVALSKLKENK